MKKFVVGSLSLLVLLVACSEDSSNKPKPVNETSSGIVRHDIPGEADVRTPTEALSKKPSQFVYAKTRCNIRGGPGTKYSIVRKAAKGERLEYISFRGNWYKLKVPEGKPQEWVHKTVVSKNQMISKKQEVPEKEALFELNKIANKSPKHVEKILGKPSELKIETFKSTEGRTFKVRRVKYRKGFVEITFIENRAKYITIFLQGVDLKYDRYSYRSGVKTLLRDLGLDENATPSFSNQFTTRWKALSGIYEISIFPGSNNRVWYVHVLTESKYQ